MMLRRTKSTIVQYISIIVLYSCKQFTLPRTPKSEPSWVNNCVRLLPYAYDSLSMWSNTLYMSNMDVGSSFVGCQPEP
jgi:hypothetical protein